MLTAQILKQNEALKDLTEDQIKAIATLSKNDENTVIAQKTGEIAGKLEADILTATGIQKNDGEKYYEYLKRAAGALKTASDGKVDPAEVDKLKAEITKLQKEKSSDPKLQSDLEEAQRKLTDAETRISQLQKNVDETKAEYDQKVAKANAGLLEYRVRSEFAKALQGKLPKEGIPKELFEETINNRISSILSDVKPEFEQTSDGKEVLRFRDNNGALMNNPKNLQNPFTAEELLTSKISDLLKEPSGGGAGTGPKGGAGGNAITIAAAKSQVEADELIRKSLMADGVSTSHPDYQSKFSEARKTNNVAALPLT